MSLSWADLFTPAILYLAPDRVILRVRGETRIAESAEAGWSGAITALKSLLDAHKPSGRMAVVLSAHFAPVWLLPSAPTSLNYEETRGWVESQVAERFGELAANWRLAFRPGPAGEPILASAIDTGHWAELLHTTTQAGLSVSSVTSWPAVALAHHAGRATARLALVEPGRLTLVSLKRGEAVALDSVRGESPENDLADLTARAALVDGLRDAPLRLVGTGVPGDWGGARVLANTPEAGLLAGRGELDFLQTRQRPPLVAWLLLAAGLGLAALAGQHYLALADQFASLVKQETAVSAGARGAHGAAHAIQSGEKPALAWGDLLNRLETQRPKQIALLSLRGDAIKGEARITAEARSAADMLAWLKSLRADAGFADVGLVQHAVQFEDGQQPLRFDIRLGWGGR